MAICEFQINAIGRIDMIDFAYRSVAVPVVFSVLYIHACDRLGSWDSFYCPRRHFGQRFTSGRSIAYISPQSLQYR